MIKEPLFSKLLSTSISRKKTKNSAASQQSLTKALRRTILKLKTDADSVSSLC